MAETSEREELKRIPPGVCVPWERKVEEIGPLAGDEEMIKKEWEKLDTFAYMYLWYWVHR
ncbi:MAG TPA: hypothetical protein VMW83_10010 [Spirochaetia bacterium]|nr:hypothetical protein [Spirochaetia bacterium]